jgi:hypothetical protein
MAAMPYSLGEFVEKGGAVLVATDRRTGSLLSDFEVEVAGDVVTQERAPDAYKMLTACPLIFPQEPAHPLFEGVESLATINPSQIVPKNRILFLAKLALFPNGCVSTLGATAGAPFIMGSDATSKHRVVVVGGHSVFMNVLLAQNDNDNFKFAVNTVRWLTDQGRRKHCLFVNDGMVAANYNIPLGGIPVPTAKLINQLLHRLEQEGIFDRIARALIPRNLVLQGLLVGTTLFLAIYLFWRVWAKRHELPREVPLLSAKVAQSVPDKTVMALRQQALLNEDNLWEVAQSLARQCFERHGLGGTSPPEVIARGGFAQKRARRRVLTLWNLAFGQLARAVRARDLARVLNDIEAVDEWLDDGLIKLDVPSRSAGQPSARVSSEVSPS